ncbi:MAG: hypothetical protein LBQ51_09525 [Desulfovibrio sp.]|jgi:hypothetical protein|nr:hypothetical protein [Desulfovibrio sp.]
MHSGTHILDADFYIVPEPFTRAGQGPFLFSPAEAGRGSRPAGPAKTAGTLLMDLLVNCGICRAPRIKSAECVPAATGAQ